MLINFDYQLSKNYNFELLIASSNIALVLVLKHSFKRKFETMFQTRNDHLLNCKQNHWNILK